jgi:hypothetical protein
MEMFVIGKLIFIFAVLLASNGALAQQKFISSVAGQGSDPAPSAPSSPSATARSTVNGIDSRTCPLVEQSMRGEIGNLIAGVATQVAHSVAEAAMCREDMADKDKTIGDLTAQISDLTAKLAAAKGTQQ